MTRTQEIVYAAIDDKHPRLRLDIEAQCKQLAWHERYRAVDNALPWLRRAGKIKYLKKADGGPGWVRT